ncbi:MAG: MBL fold metallo-hydrolase [Thermoanaerobaculales bacterium]|jgi:7,8-dihydropterin-6-yl-methyl-4-(beta-D-ribofuranosyl)aminobenzene 5'-phosphate synthase|nr:MBL fold metallo-hydrolase [Thermoanaerobaculales bacterium]
MRVVSLIDNQAGPGGLACEFGLSVHVDTGRVRVLFDFGASGAFADNAVALGIDLAAVDLAVLSHQHFDHGGGLGRFLELNDRAPVYLRDRPVEPRFFRAFGLLTRPIGLDRAVVEAHPDRIRRVAGDTEVAPGVWLLTAIGSDHPRPRGNRRLFVERDGRLERDPFDHELAMVVRDPAGLTVLTGCSHGGVLNMVDAARARFPDEPVCAVFGGFHLIGLPQLGTMAASRREVAAIGRAILDRVDGPVHTGHCTGAKGYAALATVMGDRLRPFPSGTTVDL